MKKTIEAKGSLVDNYLISPYRFYYSNIPLELRNAYDIIFRGLSHNAESIEIPKMPANLVLELCNKIKLDHVLIFNVEKIIIESRLLSQKQTMVPSYKYNAKETKELTQRMLQKSKQIISPFRNRTPAYQEQAIHDYLCSNIVYSKEGTDPIESIGPILYNSGVCDGIAKAAKLLFDLCGVNSAVVHGYASSNEIDGNQDHSWNIVNINGHFYHLDITYDLTMQMYGIQRYDYYNLSNEEIRRDHRLPKDIVIHCPLSDGFYKKTGRQFETVKGLEGFLSGALQGHSKDIVFQTTGSISSYSVKQSLEKTMQRLRIYNRQFCISYNEKQNVYHFHEMSKMT